jgi:hypothetical protein
MHAQADYKFLGCLVKEKIKLKVSACFLENAYYFLVSEAASEFLSSFSSLPLVDIHLCFSSIG